MPKLKSTFQNKPLFKKKLKNYFDYENFDRSANFRNDADWYEKLDKKDIIYIPIWRSLNLFALESDDLSQPVFLKFNDLKNFSPKDYVKNFLGSHKVNGTKKNFISIDFSILEEVEIKTLFSEIGKFLSLRDINPVVGSFESSLLAYSLGISNWHKKIHFVVTVVIKL